MTGVRHYNQDEMVKTWLVRLELARDDDGSLSDEGIGALTALLAEHHVKSVLNRGHSGTVLVEMTLDARDDRAARSAAEGAASRITTVTRAGVATAAGVARSSSCSSRRRTRACGE